MKQSSYIFNFNMKKFLSIVLISPWPTILLIMFLFVDDSTRHDKLIDFQSSKLDKINNNSTVFFGDSSCGNGIDSSIFDENTYNLSLTAGYLSCGSLEQLEELIQRNRIPKRAYFMYSINAFGYKKTRGHQLFQRTFFEVVYNKANSLKETIKEAVGFPSRKLLIDVENDFIKQTSRIHDISSKEVKIILSKDNLNCILEIVNLCNDNSIDCLFMIGPNTRKIEAKSFEMFKKQMDQNNINFIGEYYRISESEVGDSDKHIHPSYKYQSTNFYKQLLLKQELTIKE